MDNKTYFGAANENLFGLSPLVKEALQQAFSGLHSYPDPDAAPLRHAIAQKLLLHPDQLLIGSGSAELISLLVRTFCRPFHSSQVLSVAPTYPLYQLEAEALGVQYVTAPLNSTFQVDVDSLLAKVKPETRICFLSNPNNPTGAYLPAPQLHRLVHELPPHVTLVLDEAYVEYVTAPDFREAIPYLSKRENLVILRTFSKAYGLASLRVGYMIAHPGLLQKVLRVKQPYNVNRIAQLAALAALDDTSFLAHTLESTEAGKAFLAEELAALGVQSWPSQGNFLYVDAGIPVRYLYSQLLQHDIQVRLTDSPFNFRITVGRPAHQNHLINILRTLLAPSSYMQNATLQKILATGEACALPGNPQIETAIQELTETASATGTASERIAFAFARALSARHSKAKQHAGNLYSSTYGEMDMIAAFDTLIKATPLVTFGHLFSNLSILHAVEQAQEVHILDLGIGSGLQWFHLLELLAARPQGAPRVHLTGIDIPAATGEPAQRIQASGDRLKAHAETLGLSFSFTGIATKLEDFSLMEVELNEEETLVVNAALTLHHLPDVLVSQPDERDHVLQQIKSLNPKIFTLTEPDSEHNNLDYLPRLRESLRHYSTVFEVLDTLLPADMPERQVIEQEFFGREIVNVVSCEGAARVERHERNEAWQRRLVRNGFKPFAQEDMTWSITETLKLHSNFTLEPNGAGYTLHWNETPVISATAWVTEG